MTTIKLIGQVFSVFCVLLGVAIAILGVALGHFGPVISGLAIAIISALGVWYSSK